MFKVKKTVDDAKLPERSRHAAGYDLFSVETVRIPSNSRKLVDVGFRMEIPVGTVGLIKSRSSMAKNGVTVDAGVIDSDYRGKVKVMLWNTNIYPVAIEKGDKIAQMLILQHGTAEVTEVQELSETERGDGGFGSTGK